MKFIYIILIMITTIGITSCEHKELYYPHLDLVTLRLVFDWRDAPDASPMGMVVYAYKETTDSNQYQRFFFSNTTGGEIQLQPGTYRFITYNSDTEVAHGYNVHDYDDHHFFTRDAWLLEPAKGTRSVNDGLPRLYGSEEERVIAEPDPLWGCTAIDVDVSEQGVSYRCFPFEEKDDWVNVPPTVTEHIITLYPHDLLCHYSYEVRNVRNLSQVTDLCGVLTGMSSTLHIAGEHLGRDCVSIPVKAYKADGATIRGEFLTFGHHEQNDAPHLFGLYLWLRSGKNLFVGNREAHFNVTSQIHDAPDRKRVHYIIDGLELPDDGGTPGGGTPFDGTFDDWNDNNADIIM